jgi:phage terminase small subunit
MPRKPPSPSFDPPSLRVLPAAPQRVRNPPPDYSPAMQAWWSHVMAEYDLDEHHRHLLECACGAWDRMLQARDAIAEHGLTYEDDRGTVRSRPEVAIERDSRVAFVRCVRELDLDIQPPPAPVGRPPGLRSNRRP